MSSLNKVKCSCNEVTGDDCKLNFTATEAPEVTKPDGTRGTAEIKAEFFKDYFDVMFKSLKIAGGSHELVGGFDELIKGLARQYGCDASEIKKGLQETLKASPTCLDCLATTTKQKFQEAATPPAPAAGEPSMGSMSPADIVAPARAQHAGTPGGPAPH